MLSFARRMCDIRDYCLTTIGDRNVLHRVRPVRAVPFERFHLTGKGSRELIERALGTILLKYGLGNSESVCHCHRREVNRSHLGGMQRLELVSWLHIFDNRKHEIQSTLIELATLRVYAAELRDQTVVKVNIGRSDGIHE